MGLSGPKARGGLPRRGLARFADFAASKAGAVLRLAARAWEDGELAGRLEELARSGGADELREALARPKALLNAKRAMEAGAAGHGSSGGAARLAALVEAGAARRFGMAALAAMTPQDRMELAGVLLPHCDLEAAVGGWRRKALHVAAEQGDADFVAALARAGADLTALDVHGMGALELAAIHGSVACMEVLARAGARLADPGGSGALALSAAAMADRRECAMELARMGAGLRAAVSAEAVDASYPGADVHVRMPQWGGLQRAAMCEARPIHWAALWGWEDLLALCVKDAGGDMSLLDEEAGQLLFPGWFSSVDWKRGLTPLAFAAMGVRLGCAKMLLAAGCDPAKPMALSGSGSLAELGAVEGGVDLPPPIS